MSDRPAHELPLLLLTGFRSLIDGLHDRLADEGHPDARPIHGFAMQAIGPHGTTAAGLGRTLGVSKQAAGKTVDGLVALGYARRTPDPGDARRKRIELTARGEDCLRRSARIFGELRAAWEARIGAERVRTLEADLATLVRDERARIDLPGWLG